MRATSILLVTVAAMTPAQDVVPLPAFDHDGVTASYVISTPMGTPPTGGWPLLIDLHGAIAPARRGAQVTRDRLWALATKTLPWIIAAPNGRTRSWGRIRGDHDDRAYVRAVLDDVRSRHPIDPRRVFLGGFSSGSDFLASGPLQSDSAYRGSLVVCPGPAHVLGMRNGVLVKKHAHPFVFVCGEEDVVRKDGAHTAYHALKAAGGRVALREVPEVGHDFPPVAEYARALRRLEELAGTRPLGSESDDVFEALAFGDLPRTREILDAWTPTDIVDLSDAASARLGLSNATRRLIEAPGLIIEDREPGRAYEAWWRAWAFAGNDDGPLRAIEKRIPRRDLYRARTEHYRRRALARDVRASDGLWTFDRYPDHDQVTAMCKDLARRHPERVRLFSMGRSIEGRPIWVLEITDRSSSAPGEKPALYIQGGLHGNEISTVTTALWIAWYAATNPLGRRGATRLLRDTTLYIAPAVNPDGSHHHVTEPHTHWRPRFNYRPHDADGDGKKDEDPYDDLDGDGEIGLMYAADPKGPYGLVDGRLMRGRGRSGWRLVGREGKDDDGDGKFNEDRPGGINLNRNFPVGFKSRRDFEGHRGLIALSEPETQAIAEFIVSRPDIACVVDLHSHADCVFYWTGPDAGADDAALLKGIADRAHTSLGYAPKPLTHAGAGLCIAWAFGERGLPAVLIELAPTRGPRDAYRASAWPDGGIIPVRPFQHPQLGRVLIGGDKTKLAERNPHPRDIVWLGEHVRNWVDGERTKLPHLTLSDPVAVREGTGFVMTGVVVNEGAYPTETARAAQMNHAAPITLAIEGGRLLRGPAELGVLGPGERKAFRLEVAPTSGELALVISHPRAGRIRHVIVRPRAPTRSIRQRYTVKPGWATPDTADGADNEWFAKGRPKVERGPAFKVTHRKKKLRLGVLLGEWRDRRHVVAKKDFEAALFSQGAHTGISATGQPVYGSLRDLYQEMSYGQLDVTGEVFDWIELPGSWTEYRDASFGSSVLRDRLIAAFEARNGKAALDGFDGLTFVWAGNAVARTSALWPMRLTLKTRPGVIAWKMGELHHGEGAPIGVPCHEMGHTFGVNDKYGLGAPTRPMGPWCLMAKGTHGGGLSGRHRPFHLCAWCKSVIGWVRPRAIRPTSNPVKLALRPIGFGPGECFRILLEPDGNRYLLLENRRREGFHSDLPSPGLAILEVGPNDAPTFPQKRVQLLPAHGKPAAGRGIVDDLEHVAWPQPGKDRVEVRSVVIEDIRLEDDVVYFTVRRR
ncbi:MAG: hypothetical protein CMJ83_03965 [Planctomycetes bacterium]|nr:hypothetical protein [Planctomycetota bacterium]